MRAASYIQKANNSDGYTGGTDVDMRDMNNDVKDEKRNRRPLVSVVIPVYNVERYLYKCVDSVLQQTYPCIEAILVDDGSTDDSGEYCDRFQAKDSWVKVIHQENRGLGVARNVGMRSAGGKYTVFLDSDDYWMPNTLEKLVFEAEKYELQVVVFSAHSFYDGVSSKDYKGPSYSHSAQNGVVKTGVESLAFAKAHGEYYAQACLRLYRLDYLRSYGFRFDEGIIHEDESFSFLAYVHAERVMCLGERFYQRRYRPGSIMMKRNPVQSARGYRAAIETLAGEMEKRTTGGPVASRVVASTSAEIAGDEAAERVFRPSGTAGMAEAPERVYKPRGTAEMTVVLKRVVKPLSGEERELYFKQIKGYFYSIFSLYREAKRSGDRVGAEWIAEDAQWVMKKVGLKNAVLPARDRVMFKSFLAGYCMWEMRTKMATAKRSVKRSLLGQ